MWFILIWIFYQTTLYTFKFLTFVAFSVIFKFIPIKYFWEDITFVQTPPCFSSGHLMHLPVLLRKNFFTNSFFIRRETFPFADIKCNYKIACNLNWKEENGEIKFLCVKNSVEAKNNGKKEIFRIQWRRKKTFFLNFIAAATNKCKRKHFWNGESCNQVSSFS